MRKFLRAIRRARVSYTPLITVRILGDVLKKNYAAFQNAHPSCACALVLKSNAYGHGLVTVARLFDGIVPFFVVDSYVEALVLRNEGIHAPILIIGYTLPENIIASRLPHVVFTIGNLSDISWLSAHVRKQTSIHIKIDTGMHRQGITPSDLGEALDSIAHSPQLVLEGACTHFADADGADKTNTEKQIDCWNSLAAEVRAAFPTIRFFHCAATEGSKFSSRIDANCVRVGMGLYGCTQSSGVSVYPVLEMRTLVTSVRTVLRGESIGYHCTYTASRDMVVATVPVGYAEGIDRRLSNKGCMMIRGVPCPIVGRVSMNITSLDVTNCGFDISIGEEVVAIGSERSQCNSCESIARLCDTIPYEILVHIPQSLRRIVVEHH